MMGCVLIRRPGFVTLLQYLFGLAIIVGKLLGVKSLHKEWC